ncbi:MAG: hypothetical protein Q8O92_12700 [Candidatus Latescibacter sp.]|nr:hypothetical protein [Candidatus Latescibacter sp.]
MTDSSYTSIIARLKNVERRYLAIGIAEAFFAALSVFAALFILFGFIEAFSYHSPQVKTILFWSAAGISTIAGLFLFVLRYIHRPGIDELARMVERACPQFRDKLISAVQLGCLDEAGLRGQSPELVRALVGRAAEELRTVAAEKSVSAGRLLSLIRISYGAAILFLLLSIMFPRSLTGGFYRLADYGQSYSPPGNTIIFTLVRDSSIIRGENFSNSGFFSSKSAPLRLFWRWKDSDVWNTRPVKVDDKTGYFNLTIEKPRLSFLYYLESGPSATPRFRVNVIERPVVENIELSLRYPAYTGMGTVARKDNDGNIRALRGTGVSLGIRANKPLRSMTIRFSDSTAANCTVSGAYGRAAFTITRDLDYTISLIDTVGISDINPILYRIASLEDEKPTVSFLSPTADVVLPRSMTLPIVYHAEDDYGLSQISLQYKLPFEENFRAVSLKKGLLNRQIEDGYVWNLSDVNLLPEDRVAFYLSVWDNDTIRGPKQGVSEKYTLKVPSLTDILKETAEEHKAGMEKIREAQDAGSEKDKALDEVRRNILNGKKTDWNDRNAIEESKKQLEKMQESVKDFSEAVKKMADRLSNEDMAALETVEKLRKISQMMDQIADGDMKEALKKLTRAAMEMDQRAVKDALDQYQITADAVKKKLDAVIRLLEQVKAIQRYETSKKVLEDIALKQAELTQKLRNNPKNPSLAREQKSLAAEMDKLENELKGMSRELKEKFSLNTKPFEDYLNSTDISKGMEETAGNLDKGMSEKARKGMDSSNVQLSDMLKNMDKLGELMKGTNTREMKNRLLTAMIELLAVSESQEKLLANTGGYTGENLAQKELEVMDGFRKAGKTLSALGSVSLELAGIIEQITTAVNMTMKNAVDTFTAGNVPAGEQSARSSLSMVNNTILFLSNLLKNSGENQSKGMAGDLMQELQMIADGQLSLQMRMGEGSQELMKQLAAEQEKLAEMLSQLGKKLSEDKRLREMLDKLTGDMDDTAQMMRKNEKRELVERKQLDIYRRLLDARRSHREKDEESPERKSWTAKKNESLGADRLAGDLGEKQAELNERMKKALQDDINPEFKKLIRLYFESMLKTSPGAK